MKRSFPTNIDKVFQREIDPAFERRARAIFANLDLKTGKETVLDLGCGRGFYANSLGTMYPGLKLWGVDKSSTYLRLARQAGVKNVTWQEGDATNLNFENGFFDRIICSEVLEHIWNDKKVLIEMNRVLKNQGKALITVPSKNYPFAWDPANWLLERVTGKHLPANIWWMAGIWADHVRLYGEEEMIDKLKTAKFEIVKLVRTTRWALPGSHFILYGIGKNIVERGWAPSASRFNYGAEPGGLMKWVKYPFELCDKLNDIFLPVRGKPYLNLVVVAEKK